MYKNGVPEKIIQERTGHCSLESLRIYERTNCHQQEAVSNILSVPQAQNYTEQTYAASYHSQTTSVCFHSNTTDSVQRLPISFGNLCGCTINIHPIACPPPPAIPSSQITRDELDDLFSDLILGFKLVFNTQNCCLLHTIARLFLLILRIYHGTC